jgi:hypothetical protein
MQRFEDYARLPNGKHRAATVAAGLVPTGEPP